MSAYYGVFHLLTGETAALFAADPAMAALVCRTINHADIKRVSVRFGANQLPKSLRDGGPHATPPDLKLVADTFVRLQSLRHEADYDRSRTFSRVDVMSAIDEARIAFEAWSRVRQTDNALLYQACFLLWERWDKEPR